MWNDMYSFVIIRAFTTIIFISVEVVDGKEGRLLRNSQMGRRMWGVGTTLPFCFVI